MTTCSMCGKENPSEANFCQECGFKLGAVTNETTRIISVVEDEVREDIRTVELSSEDANAVRDLPENNALLIVTRGPDVGARYLLDSDEVTVGRSPKSDIFLNDVTVSRHHAKFIMGDGKVTLADQHSHNGTYVNRTLVDQQVVLRQGDEVQIGKYRMLFFASERGIR